MPVVIDARCGAKVAPRRCNCKLPPMTQETK